MLYGRNAQIPALHTTTMSAQLAPQSRYLSYLLLTTIFSSTELFPLDCEPTTAICGRSMGFCTYRAQESSAGCPSSIPLSLPTLAGNVRRLW